MKFLMTTLMTTLTKLKTTLCRSPQSEWVYSVLGASLVFQVVLVSPSYSEVDSSITNCPTGVTGLCTPGVFESSTETVTETTETDATGTTTTTTTTTETTKTTVTNEETGDLLTDQKVQEMGRNQKFGGDMSSDWGGQGPAEIKSGVNCGLLGTDKCAGITGGGSFTSTLGQQGVGTTYIQHIDMSSVNQNIKRGGEVAWSIRVEKTDVDDSVHFRIRKTGENTSESILLGTQTLSDAGATNALVNTLFQGNFDFSGQLTTLSIEVSGRNVNFAIGPMFDDVTVNVLYNVVSTIVTETITTVEEFVALGVFDQETIDVATDIFDNNSITQNDVGEVTIAPMESETDSSGPSYESVEMEIEVEMDIPKMTVSDNMQSQPVEVQTTEQNVEVEIETEMQDDITDNVATDKPVEPAESKTTSNDQSKPDSQNAGSQKTKGQTVSKEGSDSKGSNSKQTSVASKKSKSATKVAKKQEAKQKAATKIVKKMGDKGRYDDTNQIKTLVVMQVLGNTKSFFKNKSQLPDVPNFFSSSRVPDAQISDNNAAAYYMIGGSDVKMDALTDLQYR